ncbi:MAG TPA: bifunctional riboflavin kinase/FAD synthetase [Chitinophagaceae bacterium]|jgi:riboflavin kinase/FMN adenylyltransferase|nr:bifunctional riboflavin kinase/FAD synthetase [Chitinophagaceae bacterium]
MQVHYDIDKLPAFQNAIITIGTFDGVHMGHRQIIDKMKGEALSHQGETVIITFHPHPRKVVSSTILGVRLINTPEEKLELLEQAGIDHVVVVPFTDAFANQPAEDYISNFLIEKFHPHTIIIGYDHRFGRERTGDYRLLEKKSKEYGFRLIEIPKHIQENISISSTNIREAILHSDIATADSLLGYEFFFSGQVVHGDKLGRQLGYPTANLKVLNEEKITPGNGIYAVYAELPDIDEYLISPLVKPHTRLKGMMSIGFRPTVDGKKRVIEVNIFDFNEDIYDKMLKVYVKKYLREEIKFDGLEALIKQIDQDKIDSLEVL